MFLVKFYRFFYFKESLPTFDDLVKGDFPPKYIIYRKQTLVDDLDKGAYC